MSEKNLFVDDQIRFLCYQRRVRGRRFIYLSPFSRDSMTPMSTRVRLLIVSIELPTSKPVLAGLESSLAYNMTLKDGISGTVLATGK